jgi:lipoate-protein ligase A
VHDGGVTFPTFGFASVHRSALGDGIAREAEWMALCAATNRASAHLWQGVPGFIVPRRYALLPGWAARPGDIHVQVRASGGGLVPQGPGLWNLSLVWPVKSAMPSGIEAIYTGLCRELVAAFARLGLGATTQAVEGSFCDGKYNLAAGGRKFVGTAQAWRRVQGQPVLMAHAVIVVSADPGAVTDACNAYEAALGTPTRYRAEALTSIAREVADATDIEARTLTVLAEQFARAIPPRIFMEAQQDGSARVRDGTGGPG